MATIKGNRNNNTLNGSSRADFIYGYDGDDKIYAGAGDDVAYGGNGADELYGQAGADRLFGEVGNDKLDGGDGDDRLDGGDGDDLLMAGAGANILSGGAGNDTLVGGAGVDELGGGSGVDLLTGGAGADIFYFTNPGEAVPGDTVTDFEAGMDQLRAVSATPWDANSALAGLQLWELVDSPTLALANGNGQATVTSDGVTTLLQLFNNDGNLQADFTLAVTGDLTAEALQIYTWNAGTGAFTDHAILIPPA